MLGKVPVELLGATVLRVGVAIDRLVAHTDPMLLETHPAGDLLRRPASLEPMLDGSFELRVLNHLAVKGAALLAHGLGIQRVVSRELGQVAAIEVIALQIAVDGRGGAAQAIRDLGDRHFGLAPLGNLDPLLETQLKVTTTHSTSSMQTSVLIQNLHFVCESTRVSSRVVATGSAISVSPFPL